MTFIQTALSYAARGWAVFPLQPRDKRPAGSLLPQVCDLKDRKQHGTWEPFQTQLPLTSEVEAWWTRRPQANIGIATGEVSGFIVIDIDDEEGREEWAELVAMYGDVLTLTSATGGGGLHLLFAWPGAPIGNRSPFQNIHVRGDGGYIVAPPSVHPSGEAYKWCDESVPIAPIPIWLLELLASGREAVAPPSRAEPKFANSFNGQTEDRLVRKAAAQSRYAAAALRKEIQELRSVSVNRNIALNDAAFALGAFVRDGYLDRTTVERELTDAANAIGLDTDHNCGPRGIEKTIASGIDAAIVRSNRVIATNTKQERLGAAEPARSFDRNSLPSLNGRATQSRGGSEPRGSELRDDAAGSESVAGEPKQDLSYLTELPLTERGHAECLARMYGDRLRYDFTSKRWRLWDGERWAIDAMDEARNLMTDVIRQRRSAYNAALKIDEAAWKYCLRSENLHITKNGLEIAQSLNEFHTVIHHYDQNPFLANAGPVTINLLDCVAQDNQQENYITRRFGPDYDKGATCPRWVQFLSEVFAADSRSDDDAGQTRDLISFVQRACGYSLTGDTREHKLFLCYGTGANGKSTFLNTLSRLLGDYSGTTGFDTFDVSAKYQTTEARSDLAHLRAARVVTIIESGQDAELNEARIKHITGGDRVRARELYANPFEYYPQFKLWFAMNYKPIIKGTDLGIWRRILLIPFTANFSGREDRSLDEKLKMELPGILNWALDGLRAWHEQGLNAPPIIEMVTGEYRRESDLLGQWIEARCTLGTGKAGQPREMSISLGYDDYKTWCEQSGLKPLSMNDWKHRMAERGIDKKRKANGMVYVGIGLLNTP